MSNGLFLPGANGKFSQTGRAKFHLTAMGSVGKGFNFEIDLDGNPNDVMAMLYDSMKARPEVAKIMLTVFCKFCDDQKILPQDVRKHTYFAGQ